MVTSPRSTPPPYGFVPLDGWRLRAACHDHPTLPPATWDDESESATPGTHRGQRIEAAKAVCRNECPVREQCYADVDLDFDRGVRGGVDLRTLLHAQKTAS